MREKMQNKGNEMEEDQKLLKRHNPFCVPNARPLESHFTTIWLWITQRLETGTEK